MKKLLASALLMLALAAGTAYADHIYTYPQVYSEADSTHYDPSTPRGASRHYPMLYRMDDVFGNSGSRGQWVMIVKSRDIYADTRGGTELGFERYETRGGKMNTLGMVTGANIVNERNSVYLYNGFYEPRNTPVYTPNFSNPAQNNPAVMPIRQIFMVIPESQAETSIDFYLRSDLDKDATHTGSNTQPWTLDVNVGDDGYRTIKDARGQFSSNPQANKYIFELLKNRDTDKYSTLRTYLSFHQNPSESPSQTINIPLIIANVAMGSAVEKELEFNTVIRDLGTAGTANTNGQIIAAHHFTWDANSNKTISSSEGDDWLFVPQTNANRLDDTINTNYQVTIDVKNYSGLRYALQRYDLMNNAGENYERRDIDPDSWRFDLPETVTDVDKTIVLDNLSHIAPGLVTRYSQRYNIRSLSQRLMRIYPADTVSDHSSPRDLVLTHNRIGGVILGSNLVAADGVYTQRHTDVRAFYYLKQDDAFLTNNNAKSTLHLYKAGDKAVVDAVAAMPAPGTAIDVASGVSTNAFVTDAAIGTVKFNISIPEGMNYVSDDPALNKVTVLPVIVTINVPSTDPYLTRDDIWNQMLEKWRADANIKDLFHQYFRIYSRLDDNAYVTDENLRNYNVSDFLMHSGAFSDNVKVLLDEERKCLTISFMAMLVDSAIGEYGTLTDSLDVSVAGLRGIGTRKFLSILDGNRNDRWDLTMYVRRVNIGVGSGQGGEPQTSSKGGGGGGCATGTGVAICASAVWALARRKDR